MDAPEQSAAQQIDEKFAALAEDTQPEAPEAPAEPDTPTDAEQAQIDYEKRYNDLRSEFDKRNAEIKAERELIDALRSDDPSVYSQALKDLGFGGDDEPEDDPEPETTEDDSPLAARLKALEDKIAADEAAIAEQIRQQEEIAHVQSQLAEIDPDKKLEQDEVDLLLAAAYAKRGEDGLPDVKSVWNLYEKGVSRRVPQYVTSKTNAPHVPAGGQAANPTNPDLDTAEGRANLIDEVVREL